MYSDDDVASDLPGPARRTCLRDDTLYAVESIASGWALMGVTWNNAGGVIRVYAKKNANPSSSSSSSVG